MNAMLPRSGKFNILPKSFKILISSRSNAVENAQDVEDVCIMNKNAPTVCPWWEKYKAIAGGRCLRRTQQQQEQIPGMFFRQIDTYLSLE